MATKFTSEFTYYLHLFDTAQPQDCYDILYIYNKTASGSYTIYPVESRAVTVWCDMETDGGSWTVNKILK